MRCKVCNRRIEPDRANPLWKPYITMTAYMKDGRDVTEHLDSVECTEVWFNGMKEVEGKQIIYVPGIQLPV